MSDLQLLIVAPTRRDGEVTQMLLERAGVPGVLCTDLGAVAEAIDGGIGALMLTDAALAAPAMPGVLEALERQPAWSDIPVLVLVQAHAQSAAATRLLARLTNLTVLDRPVSARSMVSAVLASLRARRRQYQIRDQLAAQKAAEDALREADRHKDEFLATLAHELRNPLAPIRTGLQLLPQVATGDERFDDLQRMMQRQLGQLVKLIDELLDVSRISTGKVNLRLEDVGMQGIVEAALEGSQPAIDAAGLGVEMRLPEAPVWVRADPSRLAQVIGNLVNNAAKYTAPGGRVRITLEEVDGQAVVRVSDDGVGIPPEMLEQVFVLFAQVDRTLDRAQGGLGIGLALVRRMMELHGGTATAASDGLGRGSTFTIRLATIPAPAPRVELPASRPGDRHGLRVLVVDDNVDAANTLALMLSLGGYSIRTEYTGEDALRTAAEFLPHAVVCDIGLPAMGGYEVATRLRADGAASALLVALTGWGGEDDQRRSREAGFDVHLTKPASMESLAAALAPLELRVPLAARG